jgi:hypothetical protein
MQKFLTVFISAVLLLITTNTLATTTKSQPILADGYSNDREESLAISCLVPQLFPIYGGSNRSTVDLVKNDTFDSVTDTLHITAAGKVKAGLFDGDASFDFLKYIQDDNLSMSFIYKSNIEFMSNEYRPVGYPLNQIGQRWAKLGDPDAFYKNCGDSYVASIEHRGLLYAVLQFRFKTHIDRQRFEAKFKTSFANLGDISVGLVNDITNSKIQGDIHVFAMQEGGDAQKLVQIFAGGDPLKPSPISECSLANFGACKQIITNVMNYVSDVNKGFSGQFVIPNPGAPPINAAVKSIDTKPYDPFVSFKIPSALTLAIAQARNQLGNLLLQTTRQIQRTDYLYRIIKVVPYVYEPYEEKLDSATENLNVNFKLLRNAGLFCFSDLKNCVANRDQTLKDLQPIDPTALELPDNFAVTETNKAGTQQQLFVGVDTSDERSEQYRGVQLQPASNDKYDVTVEFIGAKVFMKKMAHNPANSNAPPQLLASYVGTDMGAGEYGNGVVTYPDGTTGTWAGQLTKREETSLD